MSFERASSQYRRLRYPKLLTQQNNFEDILELPRILFGGVQTTPVQKLRFDMEFVGVRTMDDDFSDTFGAIDKDLDGIIHLSELRHTFSALGLRPTEDEMLLLIQDITGDTSVGVPKESFLRYLDTQFAESDFQEEMAQGWKLLNASGKPFVSAVDVRAALLRLGVDLTEVEARDLVAQHDQLLKGGLTYDELASMIIPSSIAK